MKLSIENIDAKKGLRIIWVVEGALLFVAGFAVLMLWPDRLPGLIELMPYFFGIIALQATGAIGGASIKRLTEGYVLRSKNRAENGESEK